MKDKFLSLYANTHFYDNAKNAYEAVEKAFLSIPCPCCGNLPISVNQNVMIGALATVRTECDRSYLPILENLNYSANGLLKTFPNYFNSQTAQAYAMNATKIANHVYANRMGNGDEASGDGFNHRGAGWLMWTGKENQLKYGISPQNYQDINANANALAKYFQDRGIISKCLTQDWKGVRIGVNGGLIGYDNFISYVRQFTP